MTCGYGQEGLDMETDTELGGKLEELFRALPLDQAMPNLAGSSQSQFASVVETLEGSPLVLSGLWLYVDDLDRSHTLSQDIHTSTGSYWHAIMHRREGDFWNSKYWFRKVGDHPVIKLVDYDPSMFVDQCESDHGRNAVELVEIQRREWKALFDWSLKEASGD